jgi:hypothetical protein
VRLDPLLELPPALGQKPLDGDLRRRQETGGEEHGLAQDEGLDPREPGQERTSVLIQHPVRERRCVHDGLQPEQHDLVSAAHPTAALGQTGQGGTPWGRGHRCAGIEESGGLALGRRDDGITGCTQNVASRRPLEEPPYRVAREPDEAARDLELLVFATQAFELQAEKGLS